MTDIFISHATADRRLAELLVDFLVDAIGVPEKSVFCSSVPGHGNPLTYDFNRNMLDQISHPKLVILMMTPAYMDSPFCLMELGATWALELKPLPIIVPPITFEAVTKTIGLRQGWDITNSSELESIRETVLTTLDIKGRENHGFNRKKARWETDLTAVLKGIANSEKVPRAELDEVMQERDELRQMLSQETELTKSLENKLSALNSLRHVALVIESEPNIANDVSQILEGQGYVVGSVARTKGEAVEWAKRNKPDLITTEIPLADGSNGLDAVNEIQKFSDAIPIFITAYPERLLKGNRPEPAYLAVKPFNVTELASTFREAHARLIRDRERAARLASHSET